MTLKLPLSILAGGLLACSGALFAQSTTPAPDKGQRMERHEKMKAAHKKARQACEGKQGQEHRDCMRKEMCAQSKDAAKCEAHFKERSEAFNKAYDACKSSANGDAFRTCMGQQRIHAKK